MSGLVEFAGQVWGLLALTASWWALWRFDRRRERRLDPSVLSPLRGSVSWNDRSRL